MLKRKIKIKTDDLRDLLDLVYQYGKNQVSEKQLVKKLGEYDYIDFYIHTDGTLEVI